jgi:hypothetical protein
MMWRGGTPREIRNLLAISASAVLLKIFPPEKMIGFCALT